MFLTEIVPFLDHDRLRGPSKVLEAGSIPEVTNVLPDELAPIPSQDGLDEDFNVGSDIGQIVMKVPGGSFKSK